MDTMLQTKVDEDNYKDFYKSVYPMQTNSIDQLIDLTPYVDRACLLIDCCGWHYKNWFTKNIIISLENIKTAKEYKLSTDKFDKLFDDKGVWPKLSVKNPVVVLDRSPLLKYLTIEQLCSVLESLVSRYDPAVFVVRTSLLFVDDNRLVDRFYALSNIHIKNYVVEKFYYNVEKLMLEIKFARVINIDE